IRGRRHRSRARGRDPTPSGGHGRRRHEDRLPSPGSVLELRLLPLSICKRELAAAHLAVELVLDAIDIAGARIRLRPEVAWVGRVAAELETDEMVLLIVGRAAALSVGAHLLDLQRVRVLHGRADGPRPAVDADGGADVRLRDVRVEDA